MLLLNLILIDLVVVNNNNTGIWDVKNKYYYIEYF